ncbi:IclR family transcriptional regulator [Arthrobacter mangrovi]|uniref:IclR family transcriptional regulator n=1 Tax=Arthrobacter mangrovi TaxID=2966350 RepID=A0ABQ5MZW7_9MICC|nr:IclR family transcriptional regulator [Arthrobacter mangrovi]
MVTEPAGQQPAYYVKSVEKTFAVLLAFTSDEPRLTMTRVAAKADLSRAAARRFLLTLADLGYVSTDGTHFELTPRALDIGASFLANLTLPQIAEPHLRQLAVDLNETTSLCILDGTDVVYIARVAAPRLLSVSVNVGTRFPAWATSMGRILLAGLPPAHREAYYKSIQLTPFTENTVASIDALRSEVDRAAELGWSLVSRELDDGLRGLAVPVKRGNDLIAALNVSLQTHRMPEAEIAETVLPCLQQAAEAIASDFGGRSRGVA